MKNIFVINMPLQQQAISARAEEILAEYKKDLSHEKRRGALYLLEKALGAETGRERQTYTEAFRVWVSENPDSQTSAPIIENISLGVLKTKPEGDAVLDSVRTLRKKYPDQKVGITYIEKPGGFEVVVEGPQDLLREFNLEYSGRMLESARVELDARAQRLSDYGRQIRAEGERILTKAEGKKANLDQREEKIKAQEEDLKTSARGADLVRRGLRYTRDSLSKVVGRITGEDRVYTYVPDQDKVERLKAKARRLGEQKIAQQTFQEELDGREAYLNAGEADLETAREAVTKGERKIAQGRERLNKEAGRVLKIRGTLQKGLKELRGQQKDFETFKGTDDYQIYQAFLRLKDSERKDACMRARVIQTQMEKLPVYLQTEVFSKSRYPHLELDVLDPEKMGELNSYFADLGNLGEMEPVDEKEFDETMDRIQQPHRNRLGVVAVRKEGKVKFPEKLPCKTIEAYSSILKIVTPAEIRPAESRVPIEPEGSRVVFHGAQSEEPLEVEAKPVEEEVVEFKPVEDVEPSSNEKAD